MTPKTSYKFTYKSRDIITQEEIDNLPHPPQEWIDEMERVDNLHRIRVQLEKMMEDHTQNYFNEKLHKINITAHEFRAMDYEKQLRVHSELGSIVEVIYGEHIAPYNSYNHIDIWSKTTSSLMLGDRPRKTTYERFNRYVDGINRGLIDWNESYDVEEHFKTTKIPEWMRNDLIEDNLLTYFKKVEGIDHKKVMKGEYDNISRMFQLTIDELRIYDNEWWSESFYSCI